MFKFICNPPTADKIGFVLHNSLINSYVIFRRLYFVGRLRSSFRLRKACFVPFIGVTGYQAVIIRVSGYQGDPF